MNKRLDTGAFIKDLPYYKERVDLAAAFRWTARLDMHEAVATIRNIKHPIAVIGHKRTLTNA